MQQIPLQAVPSQSVRVILDSQNCQLAVYQKTQGLFVDITVDSAPIVSAILARDGVPLACRGYVGIKGNLLFVDTQGADDPDYTGLAGRFALLYLTADEYAQFISK